MEMRYLYFLLPLLTMSMTALAGERSADEARQIASAVMDSLGSGSGVRLVESTTANAKGTAVAADKPYYVYAGDAGTGFVIVAKETMMPAIVGYSASGTYDTETMPDGLTFFLEAYEDMVERASEGDNGTISRIMQARAAKAKGSSAVEPLLDDIAWGQDEPYNNMCPTISGSSTVAGCGAVAMSQIMRFHKHPASLQADIPSYSYTLNGSSVTIDEIEAGYEYDWDNMLPSYSGSYTDEEAEAVAALVYHAGAALETYYAWSASSTRTPYDEMYTYFDYDEDTYQLLYASSFNLNDWNEIMQSELSAGRPIFYMGNTSDDDGHAFVCDGVDDSGLYHINWGWTGSQNGYFDITILNPEKGGIGSGDSEDGYNRDCCMIVGITPDNGETDEPYYYQPAADVYSIENFSITSKSRSSSTETFGISVEYEITNYTFENFSGMIGVGILEDDGSVSHIYGETHISLNAKSDIYINAATCDFDLSYAFPIGNSVIVAVYSTDNGSTWQMCGSGEYNAIIVNATETTLTEVDRTVSATVEAAEELLAGTNNLFTLTATNTLGAEFTGSLYVYVSTSTSQPSDYDESFYLRIPTNDSVSISFDIAFEDAGTVYVWVEDEFGNILVDAKEFSVSDNDDPELTVTSFTTNASSTDYDTENYYYSSYLVKVPKVYGDTLFVTWTIENTGGTYRGDMITKRWEHTAEASSTYYLYTMRTTRVSIPASSTYQLCDTLLRSEFDTQCVLCSLQDEDEQMDDVDKFTKLYLSSSSSSYIGVSSSYVAVYFDDIEDTSTDGISTLSSSTAKKYDVYTITGIHVVTTSDSQVISSLPRGIYIINGKKVAIK